MALAMDDIDFGAFTFEGRIYLSRLANIIRRVDPGNENVKDIVSFVLSKNENFWAIQVNENNPFEEKLLAEFVSRRQIQSFIASEPINAKCIPELLRRGVLSAAKSRKESIQFQFVAVRMSAAQAKAIFSVLRTATFEVDLLITWDLYDKEIKDCFSRYLQDSSDSLHYLSLGWAQKVEKANWQSHFCTTFDAISKSPKLKILRLYPMPLPITLTEEAAARIARCVASSSSIDSFILVEDHHAGEFTMDHVQRALLNTLSLKTFDLFFKRGIHQCREQPMLRLERSTPFKQVLSQNVPLAVWPLILSKANRTTNFESHSCLDFMYFLLKEKNDVLLQNVRRRRIRKRKRYVLEE